MSPWLETRSEQAQASNRTNRERILTGSGEDVTEAVVTVLDCLHNSLDWGSDFLAETDVEDATHLMQILGFKCWVDFPTGGKTAAGYPERIGPCLLVIGHDGPHEAAAGAEGAVIG